MNQYAILLEKIRAVMRSQRIDVLLIPGSDAHLSEYLPDCWAFRRWVCGFTGSAGRIVITLAEAALETDSRYFIQAENQLKDTPYSLIRAGEPGSPSLLEWIASHTPPQSRLAVDPELISGKELLELQLFTQERQMTLVVDFTPLSDLWEDRPAFPATPIRPYPIAFSGATTAEKWDSLLQQLRKQGCEGMFVGALDELAWLFNLRGADVPYNPVAVGYGFVSAERRILFTSFEKVSSETAAYLSDNNIELLPYSSIWNFTKEVPAGVRILVDPARINARLFQKITSTKNYRIGHSPLPLLKAIRNETELKGLRNCMIKDGVALVRFLKWLEESVPQGEVTESSIADRLRLERARQPLFIGESFGTIAGYNAHGAIVHYEATQESNATLHSQGLLLIDSGAQYEDGTTDLTRTIALGELSFEQRKHITLVLKGHIALATARFPMGTRGAQLDALARQFLWKEGLLYLHGTGHGVGHFLNVHEGPQNIRLEENSTPLLPGMVTSNEPGLYLSDRYGIRIENLILTVKDGRSEFGDFLRFETLTLCPIDRKCIEISLLSSEELAWLNHYHQHLYEVIAPHLDTAEHNWLRNATRPL